MQYISFTYSQFISCNSNLAMYQEITNAMINRSLVMYCTASKIVIVSKLDVDISAYNHTQKKFLFLLHCLNHLHKSKPVQKSLKLNTFTNRITFISSVFVTLSRNTGYILFFTHLILEIKIYKQVDKCTCLIPRNSGKSRTNIMEIM